MFVWKKKEIVKEDPTLHGSWESRRAEVQLLDLNAFLNVHTYDGTTKKIDNKDNKYMIMR